MPNVRDLTAGPHQAPPKSPTMVSKSRTERASYYEQRAEQARIKADEMLDLEARRTMLQVSDMWRLMARQAKGQ